MSPATKSDEKKKKSRVFLVDDHPVVRKGLSLLINHEDDLEVCGEAEDVPQAVKAISSSKPDVVIVDISLQGTNGLELIKILKVKHPRLPLLVMSMHDEMLYAERALRAGAKGYVMKQEGTEKVIQGIRKVLKGEICVGEDLTSKMLSRLADGKPESTKTPLETLSDRELEVFQYIGQGLSTRQIAEKLCLSIKTVESYREHIKEKMRLRNATELMHEAIQLFRSDNKI